VIPTRENPVLVRRAIASVLKQTYPGPVECIVVHDREAPDQSLASTAKDRVVRTVTNTGTPGSPAASRNSGFAVARGDILALLDDDDVWVAEKLAVQVPFLMATHGALVAATGLVLHAGAGQSTLRRPANLCVDHADLLRSRVMELHPSNLIMHRSALELTGGYDEALAGAEDYDWLLRVSRHRPIYVTPEPLVHVYRDRSLARPERWQRIATAREQLLSKHPDLVGPAGGAGTFLGKLAFAHAAAGHRWEASRFAVRATKCRPLNPWALLGLAVAWLHLPVRWVQRFAGKLGRSI
jgi:glycosyltransferase involved in cell wall biosynthesis